MVAVSLADVARIQSLACELPYATGVAEKEKKKKISKLTDIENKLVVTSGKREQGRGEIGIKRHKLLYIT